MPAGVKFAALDTLSFSCSITGLDDQISRCLRLRVLRLTVSTKNNLVIVHSTSPQELFVDSIGRTERFDIVAPVLRQYTVSLAPYVGINVSMLAPTLEMISWYCCYVDASVPIGYGHWRLIELMLKNTAARQGQLPSLCIHADIVCVFSCSILLWLLTKLIKLHKWYFIVLNLFSSARLLSLVSWPTSSGRLRSIWLRCSQIWSCI
jgi:hypothetical protein